MLRGRGQPDPGVWWTVDASSHSLWTIASREWRVATLPRAQKGKGVWNNIIVSGGTSTGTDKTTLLRALLTQIAVSERLVIIEDTPEPTVRGYNVVHLHTTLNTDLAILLRQTLRLTPDRITLGEVRGPEALELVRAMNTGHDGTLCTLNSAAEDLRRLHTLVVEAQPSFPFAGIASADVIQRIEARGLRRRLADIWCVPRESETEVER
jgi:type IV secretion system protein TrbB